MTKSTLYKLSIVASLLSATHFYKLDKECFFYYLFFSLVLLILPLLWNKWLYREFTQDIKRPISYTTFVNIGNFVYLALILFFIVLLLTNYIPANYIQGICSFFPLFPTYV